jgi:hypothetical protein
VDPPAPKPDEPAVLDYAPPVARRPWVKDAVLACAGLAVGGGIVVAGFFCTIAALVGSNSRGAASPPRRYSPRSRSCP